MVVTNGSSLIIYSKTGQLKHKNLLGGDCRLPRLNYIEGICVFFSKNTCHWLGVFFLRLPVSFLFMPAFGGEICGTSAAPIVRMMRRLIRLLPISLVSILENM